MPDLGEPLGSDSGKPFSESYLGGLPGNWAPTRSTSPLHAEFQGVTCWAGFVVVLTAKRYQIPNVGSVGNRPIPAPTPHRMGGQAPEGTLWTLVLQSRVSFTASGCT